MVRAVLSATIFIQIDLTIDPKWNGALK